MDAGEVSLRPAAQADATLIDNLLELYAHDLSECFAVDIGPDGRFGYDQLSLYWSEPERRFPFLIQRDGQVVGFAFAARGSPISDDVDVYDVAEFFVLRRYRRLAVGRLAAHLLWNRFHGRWMVRVFATNGGALRFWQRTIANYLDEPVAPVDSMDGRGGAWKVFKFSSAGRGVR
jgi:predicted acetyltransferase